MGLRFRKRVKIAPGISLNISSHGTSWSFGRPGATINFGGRGGASYTVGIPGTGFSYRGNLFEKGGKANRFNRNVTPSPGMNFVQISQPDLPQMTPVSSASIDAIKDAGLPDLVLAISESNRERADLKKRISELERKRGRVQALNLFIANFITKKLCPSLYNKRKQLEEASSAYLKIAREDLQDQGVYFDWGMDQSVTETYRSLRAIFSHLTQCEKIWDVTASRFTNKFKERTQASKVVDRTDVVFDLARPECLPARTDDEFSTVPRLGNANGGDLYIFPGFILIENQGEFAAIPIDEVITEYTRTPFAETDGVPQNTKIEGNTWRYANKNGGPDRRFKDNYAIPWAIYGGISIRYKGVVNEQYLASREGEARRFCKAMDEMTRVARMATRNSQL